VQAARKRRYSTQKAMQITQSFAMPEIPGITSQQADETKTNLPNQPLLRTATGCRHHTLSATMRAVFRVQLMITGILQTPIKKFRRFVVRSSTFFLPEERRLQLEREHRGKEQLGKLNGADYTVASYGNSGRTWFRVMLSRYFSQHYGLGDAGLINFDNFHRRNRAVPIVFVTHDNFIKDYTGNIDSKADFYGSRTLLLVRNPADVSISQYFQWQHRMKLHKVSLNRFPPRGTDVSPFEFVMREASGIPKIIDFLNVWANDIDKLEHFAFLRYEDLRQDTAGELTRALEFLGEKPSAEEVADAVAYGSIENMRALEQKAGGLFKGGRLAPGDKSNPDSYKVRRAKVGGWRDYFTDAEVGEIEALINAKLSPLFGYQSG
jgi:hypothetical protein